MRFRPRRCLNLRLCTLALCVATITFSCGSCDISVDARTEVKTSSPTINLISAQTELISAHWS